jgi:type IV secretory pathway protease TraF
LGSGHSKEWRLLDDEIFVVGDNLATANDSRYWGPLKVRAIIGVVDDSYDNTTAPQY